MAQLWAGRSGGRGRQRPAGEAVGVGQRAPAPPGIGEVLGRSLGTGDVGVATGGAAGVPGPHEALSLGVHGFGGLQSGRPGHLQKMLRMEASPGSLSPLALTWCRGASRSWPSWPRPGPSTPAGSLAWKVPPLAHCVPTLCWARATGPRGTGRTWVLFSRARDSHGGHEAELREGPAEARLRLGTRDGSFKEVIWTRAQRTGQRQPGRLPGRRRGPGAAGPVGEPRARTGGGRARPRGD